MNKVLPLLLFVCVSLLFPAGIMAQYQTTSGTGLVPFMDISQTGTPLGNLGDDLELNAILPFSFTFFGVEYAAPVDLRIGSNGGILINTESGDIPIDNTALPSGLGPVIFPLWEDLAQGDDGDVYIATMGSAPFRTYIVQWDMYTYVPQIQKITFQVKLSESTNIIAFSLEDIESAANDDDNLGASATVGIEGDNVNFVQFSFNEPLSNQLGIIFDDPEDDADIVTTLEPVDLAAINEINVTLNDRCEAFLVPSMILTGEFDVDDDGIVPDASSYGIIVMDSDTSNGPTIDGCGTFTWKVDADPALIEGITTLWGTVNAEDKIPPRLVADPMIPDDLLCDEVEDVTILDLPESVSRCFTVDGQTGQPDGSFNRSALGRRLLEGGGIPTFYDGCSDIEVCVQDVIDNSDPCSNITLTRFFTASDGDCPSVSGEENETIQVEYQIIFYRPSIDDVEAGSEPLPFDCTEYTAEDPNPLPRASDFPIARIPGVGQFRLNRPTCGIIAEYTDGPRILTDCPDTYKFLRTFTVVDWCPNDGEQGGTRFKTFTQLVKVGDFTPPTIEEPSRDQDFDGANDDDPFFFSTNDGCAANFVVPTAEVSDDCSEEIRTVIFVYPDGDLDGLPIGPFPMGGLAFGIPPGDHIMQYVATDECGNEDTLDVEFTVGDRTAPVAKCEDALNISLGGDGRAIIRATDVDKSSFDDCSEVTLDIACVNANNEPIADDGDAGEDPDNPQSFYDPVLPIDCDDLGQKMIGLRVTDAAGNVNFCWLLVTIEDKIAPICLPPAFREITCDELIGNFPEDLNDAFDADPEGTSALLDARFGAANGVDNCSIDDITQTVDDQRNNCGKGAIIRTFTVTDGEGFENAPNSCIQKIEVGLVHEYTITFPADAESDECVEPGFIGISTDENGCDLITINTKVDTFSATADECYKLRITYELLNWCEYEGNADPYVIPRDADDDDDFNEATYLHVRPRDKDDLSDDIAELDRDDDPTNNHRSGDASFIANLDLHDGGLVPGDDENGYGGDASRGHFLYRQFIKVYDDRAPELSVIRPDGPGLDNDGDCLGNIELSFTLNDDCSPESVSSRVEIDYDIEDTNDDGVITLAEFTASGDVSDHVVALGGGEFIINLDDLPLGRHAIRIAASDGCGNTSVEIIVFEIRDNKAPTPICINGLTVTLMPDGQGGGMAAIWASDYVASPATDCSGPVKYAIYRASDASVPGFEPDTDDVGLTLTCDDDATTIVRIYAIDPQGQSDYCEVTLLVQLHQENLCTEGAGALTGVIRTEFGEAMPGVEVSIAGETTITSVTDNQGRFDITGLNAGTDYTLIPYLNTGHMVGVTTFDILAISRHILGLSPFTTPYQFIAADVNRSQEITVIDLIALRRLILGLDDDFENNTSWRFVDDAYDFPQGTNPWAEVFPEVANFNNLTGPVNVDFMGVKIGDLNGDASPLGVTVAGPRSTATQLKTDVNDLTVGTTTVQVFAEERGLIGMQSTLELLEGVELIDIIDGQATSGSHFGRRYLDRGMLTFSFDLQGAEIDTEEPLFALVLRSDRHREISDAIRLGDRFIRTEAYTREGEWQGLTWNIRSDETSAGNYLYPNFPNPVLEETRIDFELGEASDVAFTVSDLNGRTLHTQQLVGMAGANTLILNRRDLGAASGVLTYTLVSKSFTASRQMIVVR